MHRYDNVKYNGFNLSEVCDIEEIRLPILPSNKISTLDIASRDGEIYNGKKYESYVIEIDILIDCDTKEELNEKLKDIRDIFDVDEPKPFYINKERFILAILQDKIEKDPVCFYSYESTIKLFCPEPYFYSDEITAIDAEGSELTCDVTGNRSVSPIIQIGFSTDAYYAQLEHKETGERILVGKYPTLSLSAVKQSTKVLYDKCEDTSGWTTSSASIGSDRTVGGTLAVSESGNSVIMGTVPSGDTTWKGVCVRQDLSHSVDEFKLTAFMRHNSTGKNGDPSKPKYKNEDEKVLSGSKTPYYMVTSSTLNVRKVAGTNYKKIGTFKYGHKIKNGTAKNGWLSFDYEYTDKNKKTVKTTGYCSLSYLSKEYDTTEVKVTVRNFVVISDDNKENVSAYLRKSPKKSSKALAKIPVGTCVRCIMVDHYDDKSKITYYKLAKKYKGYIGYIAKGNLVSADNAVYSYPDEEDFETADDKTGIIELYGFGVNGEKLFTLGMYDDNAWYEYTYPKCTVGSRTVLKDSTKVPKPNTKTYIITDKSGKSVVTVSNKLSGKLGSWNEYYGQWTLSREKINKKYVWNVTVTKIKDGKTIKSQSSKNLKYSDLPTEKLAYVVLYIGTTSTLDKSSAMSLTHIRVDELNPKEQETPKNIVYFQEGDVLEIDCENHRCYLNDEPCDDLVDIGSRYFELDTGENNIKTNSNDTDTTTSVIFRDKWLGE